MSENKYIKIPIKGMHCRSCEILIEDKLKEITHVQSASLNYKTGEAIVYYHNQAPQTEQLNKAIREAGYEIGRSEKIPFLSPKGNEYYNLGIALLILMVIYFGLNLFGLTNLNFSPNLSSPSSGLIILIGLVAGFSTCMALVGGLTLGLSSKYAESHPNASVAQKFRPHIFFVMGRILGYAFLGGILGALGTVLKFSSLTNGVITLLLGIVMLIMGLQLINIFPRLSNYKLTLPKGLARIFGISNKSREYSHKNSMIMGALTFFLPCGFTQAMQLYAVSTGSFGSGAFIMGMFALGTAPGLLSIGGLTSIIRGSLKERFFKVAGLAVIFFGLFNLNNGYTLVSLSFDNLKLNNQSQELSVIDPNVTLENGIQVVRMTENNNGYSPNSFSIKKGVPVKLVIDARAPYSCASTIIIPKLNISKGLKSGENVIEFTPSEAGKLPFSCSMGMYTGVFNVYDGDQPVSVISTALADVNSAVSPVANSSSGTCGASSGGCGCGGGGAKIVSDKTNTPALNNGDVQLIKTSFTVSKDIQPNSFTVKAGKPVRFEIFANEDGVGCMSGIEVQTLFENPQRLVSGKTVVMEFTPTTPGDYLITCAMGIPRGTIKVQ